MTLRPRILFYCQHSLGMGHLIRSLSLADALAKQFHVVFLNGGPMPEGVTPSPEIEVINLPPLGFDMNMKLSSRDSQYTVEQAQSLRTEILQSAFQNTKPHVVLIELFPFGRKKFSGELLPLLDAAHAARDPQPVIVCSLRDILVTRDQDHDERAAQRANHYFDAVLVHSDERFARLEESFHPRTALSVPVHYTGFVARPKQQPAMKPVREQCVVVSAGGGIVGEALLQTAIRAYDLLKNSGKVAMKVIGGPFIPEGSWQALQKLAENKPGLQLQRFVPDLEAELRQAAASVSQCGYNTAMEILRSRVPALVVPFSTDEENEQMNRARRLERLGALRVMDPAGLEPQALAKEIDALLDFQPAAIELDLNGAENAAHLLMRLVQQQDASTNGFFTNHQPTMPAWLEPASQALDELKSPANVFFRDDDGGWRDDRLLQLLDIFGEHGLPLDVAAIPAALTTPLVDELTRRMAVNPESVHVHQHGCTHTNHETEGKKCEFGSARDYAAQRSDIENGQRRLKEFFGDLTDPIFTPPWNRCTDATVKSLGELGFAVLSRDSHATPFAVNGIFELPITLDWFANKKKVRFTLEEWGKLLAEQIKVGGSIGIMLHHAVMDETEMQNFSKVLALLSRHKNVKCHAMRALTPLAGTAAR